MKTLLAYALKQNQLIKLPFSAATSPPSMAAYNTYSPFLFIVFLGFLAAPNHALNVGLHADVGLKVNKECSRTCESKFCEVPPFLRYGKYCGILYSGCPGEQPCDRLDACCMKHDQCIQLTGNDYLSQHCNREFLNCVERFRRSGAPTFKGNTCKASEIVDVIKNVMNAAIIAGKVFGKP